MHTLLAGAPLRGSTRQLLDGPVEKRSNDSHLSAGSLEGTVYSFSEGSSSVTLPEAPYEPCTLATVSRWHLCRHTRPRPP
jgi:hypothetical protein